MWREPAGVKIGDWAGVVAEAISVCVAVLAYVFGTRSVGLFSCGCSNGRFRVAAWPAVTSSEEGASAGCEYNCTFVSQDGGEPDGDMDWLFEFAGKLGDFCGAGAGGRNRCCQPYVEGP